MMQTVDHLSQVTEGYSRSGRDVVNSAILDAIIATIGDTNVANPDKDCCKPDIFKYQLLLLVVSI